MIRKILLLALISIPGLLLAQNTNWSTTNNIGIGLNNPNRPLCIEGNGGPFRMYSGINGGQVYLGLYTNGSVSSLRSGWLGFGSDGTHDLSIANEMYQGKILMRTKNAVDIYDSGADANLKLQFNGKSALTNFNTQSSANDILHINRNWANGSYYSDYDKVWLWGKVVIGDIGVSNVVGNYGLWVEHGILTEQVKVAVIGTSSWSDFVFEPDYELKPLTEVNAYIQQHKHLPDVPSAEEIVEEGLDLGKMDALLLQKIEELTLYIIELQKQVKALQAMNNQ